jgi:hypothetical protein
MLAAPRRLVDAVKAALRARNVSRSTRTVEALQRIRAQGFLALGRDILRLSRACHSPSRRAAFLIERGGTPSTFDAQPQPIPLEAAAILSGLYAFLSDLPRLAARRAVLQGRRRVDDVEILGRFGSQWLAPSGSPLPQPHHLLQTILVEEFELGSVVRHEQP